MKNGATQGTPTPPTKVANTNAYAFLICFADNEEQEISMGTHGTCAGFLFFGQGNFCAHTDVIAQSLKNGSELCYTICGRCFMLSLNYEISPKNRCFSSEAQSCLPIWHKHKKFGIPLFSSIFPLRSKWFPRTTRSWRLPSTLL